MTITGIDVSAYQPVIDWRKVADAGHLFAFVKFTEGNGWVSKYARKQRDEARAAGLLVGAYHFARWETPGDPIADARDEAQHFFDEAGPCAPGDLPPVLDLEWITGKKRNADALVLWALTFLRECTEWFGRSPIVYTGPSFWRYCLAAAKFKAPLLELTGYTLWIVDYGGKKAPRPMHGAEWPWHFWQHTGSGSCPGIPGKCDLNRFVGTLDDLRAFADLPPLDGVA